MRRGREWLRERAAFSIQRKRSGRHHAALGAANGKLGTLKHLPPTLSLVYYPLAFYGAPGWPVEAMLWVMVSQFALGFPNNFHQCTAVSATGDPLGAWHRYDFLYSTTKMNDYPHFGIWPDGYYVPTSTGAISPWCAATHHCQGASKAAATAPSTTAEPQRRR